MHVHLLPKNGGLSFHRQELSNFIFSMTSITIVIFLFKWGNTDFSLTGGISYLIFLLLSVGILLYLTLISMKWFGHSRGYDTNYETYHPFMIAGIILGLLFSGFLFIIFPGQVVLGMSERGRLGQFRNHIWVRDVAMVTLHGLMFLFGAGILFLILYGMTGSSFMLELLRITILLSLYLTLPVPRNAGLAIFWWHRTLSVILFGAFFLFFLISFVIAAPSTLLGFILSVAMIIIITLVEWIPKLKYT